MNTTCLGPAREARRGEAGARRLCVTAASLAVALEDSVERFVNSAEDNLGHLETQVSAQAQELLRQATEGGAQKKADALPLRQLELPL